MCGIIGIIGDARASDLSKLGLYALQHRGQEANGIIVSDGQNFDPPISPSKYLGLVHYSQSGSFRGHIVIAHVRYSTQGSNILDNAQPHFAHLDDDHTVSGQRIYLASNGDITNLKQLRQLLNLNGISVETSNDGEVLVKIIGLLFKQRGNMILAIQQAMKMVEGSFSAVLLEKNALYAFRDAYGFRPLVMGRRDDGAFMFASETVALDLCGFNYLREVKAGEICLIKNSLPLTMESYDLVDNNKPLAKCIFEPIYFSHPCSTTFGLSVDEFRRELGKKVAEIFFRHQSKLLTENGWLVSAVPDSSNAAAIAVAKQLGLCFDFSLTRSHYIGRSFIDPDQGIRDFDVKMKFTANNNVIRGKNIILVDDSIVRGTTMKKIVALLKKAGAKSVHLIIASPPIKFSCHMGIDTHVQSQLIAARSSVEEIKEFMNADSLTYNTMEALECSVKTLNGNPEHFCYACFNGTYPCGIEDYQ